MTTLPTIPTRSLGHPEPSTERPTAEPSVRVQWRVLEREPAETSPRGGPVRMWTVEAALTGSSIVIRRMKAGAEVAVLVLPARSRVLDTPAGRLLDCHVFDGPEESPALRVLSSPGSPTLVRCNLLDRIGVDGGRHEILSIEIPTRPATD